MASQLNWTGGCLCGTVRFELKSAPFDAGWCHCRTCQLNSGAPAMVFASVADGDWVAVEGNEAIRTVQEGAGTVLVTGSFHTVGDVMAVLGLADVVDP